MDGRDTVGAARAAPGEAGIGSGPAHRATAGGWFVRRWDMHHTRDFPGLRVRGGCHSQKACHFAPFTPGGITPSPSLVRRGTSVRQPRSTGGVRADFSETVAFFIAFTRVWGVRARQFRDTLRLKMRHFATVMRHNATLSDRAGKGHRSGGETGWLGHTKQGRGRGVVCATGKCHTFSRAPLSLPPSPADETFA